MLVCTVWAGASLLTMGTAQAQFYTWGGTGSTTATTDYNLGTNWSNPPAGAPPVGNAQAAIFDATGSASIVVTSTVTPYSWTFNANSQSYMVSGSDVNFGSAAWGVFNLANSGQTISISNNIGETTPVAQVRQLGASTLILSGNNTYTGGTIISAGTLQATNNNSVGTGAISLDGGTFQADGASNLTFSNGVTITPNGGTVDNNGTVLTLSGVIANDGGFVATGALQLADSSGGFGITLLSGTNTYAGGTKVAGATLQVSNDSAVGTGLVTLENGLFMAADNVPAGSLTFANNFAINNTGMGSAIDVNGWSLTITGNIVDGNGPGKLTVLDSFGGGVLVLLGTNTYSGGTFICNCGSLQLGDATHVASLVGAVVNDGVFNIVNANTAGITSITTEGFFAQTSFFGSNTAGTATLTNKNGGITAFFDSSTAGSANIINRTGGTTLFGNPGGTDTSTAGTRPSTTTMAGSSSPRRPMRAPRIHQSQWRWRDIRRFTRRPRRRPSSTITAASSRSASLSAPTRRPPGMPSSPTIPAARPISTRSPLPAMPSSPPTTAAPRFSLTMRPATRRSSSPSAPALLISPAVSVRTVTAALPRVRSRVQAPIISAPAIRLSPAATTSRQ